ncbi:phage Gp37/Gp68 family protein [Billgrantia azerbaijanica]|nr:phage Gp37/Gp68 family protein [Halomonas azerbaijanica]
MADKSQIEWTDATWNPIRGCSRVSEGCRHCYAETVAQRFSGPGQPYEGLIAKGGQWNGEVVVVDHKLDEPCRWTRPRRIFVNSMSDLFHESVPFEVVAGIFGIMAAASWHTFQVLTKRPERAREFFEWMDNHHERRHFDTQRLNAQHPGCDWRPFFLADIASRILPNCGAGLRVELKGEWPLDNVWLGVSVEDQAAADARISHLLNTPAAVRFVSAEPLLGVVEMTQVSNTAALAEGQPWINALGGYAWDCTGPDYVDTCSIGSRLDWVIVGGESGKQARPMHPEWARKLRDQCAAGDVPFLFKQWGEWLPDNQNPSISGPSGDTQAIRVGKKAAGRLLDGKLHDEYPEVAHG